MMSLRKTQASSISRTYGRISSRANFRTVLWKKRSSSLSAVRGRRAASASWAVGMLCSLLHTCQTAPLTALRFRHSCVGHIAVVGVDAFAQRFMTIARLFQAQVCELEQVRE